MHCKWLIALGCSIISAAAFAGVFYPEGATTLHFAFEGSPNGDRPIIRPPAFYAEDAGFGFVDSPMLVGTSPGVTAPKYFRFDVNLPPGNYDVTVRVGGTPAAGKTTIRSEAHRAMVFDVPTAARANTMANFTVNVRASTAAAANEKSLNLDGRMTLEFTGDNPSMMKLDIKPNTTAPTLFILSDEFAADREDSPRAGWGQMLPLFFKPVEVAVANWSFDDADTREVDGKLISRSGPLTSFQKALRPGDFVLIALTSSDDGEGAPTLARYNAALKSLLGDLRARKAIPLFATTPARHDIDITGKVRVGPNPNTPFLEWVRQAAAAEKVPLLDLAAASDKWLQSLDAGSLTATFTTEDTKTALVPRYLSPYGAFEHARLLALLLRDSKIELAAHLYPDIPPSNPDPKQFPASLGYDDLKKSP